MYRVDHLEHQTMVEDRFDTYDGALKYAHGEKLTDCSIGIWRHIEGDVEELVAIVVNFEGVFVKDAS